MSIDGGRVFHTIKGDNKNCRSLKRIREEASPSYWLSLDVICSILVKLPVKSSLRFRSVCKSWNQRTFEPSFIKLQLIESRRKSSRILLMTKNDTRPDLKSKMCLYSLDEQGFIPELLLEREVLPEFSPIVSKYDCDGYLLIYSQKDIYLWNPSTRETLHLPDFTYNVPLMDDTTQHIGFGYDPTANLYKVVRLFYRSFSFDEGNDEIFNENIGCEVFVLGTKSWRQLEDPPYGPMLDFSASAKGVIYWMTLTDYITDAALLSFDISKEKFGVIRPPSAAMKFLEDMACIHYLLNGHGDTLWLVHVDWDSVTSDIWELTDATKHSWRRIHRIHCEPIVNKYYIVPKLVIRNGRCILLGNDEKLQCYDIGSKECKEILAIRDDEEGDCEKGCGNYVDEASDLFPSIYSETLVSLKAT